MFRMNRQYRLYPYRERAMEPETKMLMVGALAVIVFMGGFLYTHPKQTPSTAAPAISATEENAATRELSAPASSQDSAMVTPSHITSHKVPTESVDSRGIRHRRISVDETLCSISKKEYGTTAFAIDLAWFNGFNNPDRIRQGGRIQLPPSGKLLTAPFGWPEVPAASEQIASRSLLNGEDLVAATQVADNSVPTQLAVQPEAKLPASTRHHIVVKGERTILDVARNEYHLDLYGLGLALGAANRLEGRTRVSLGEDLIVPSLGEIRPANLVATATTPETEVGRP
jgi:hypothetical protein